MFSVFLHVNDTDMQALVTDVENISLSVTTENK